jgi:hypothetical protein
MHTYIQKLCTIYLFVDYVSHNTVFIETFDVCIDTELARLCYRQHLQLMHSFIDGDALSLDEQVEFSLEKNVSTVSCNLLHVLVDNLSS